MVSRAEYRSGAIYVHQNSVDVPLARWKKRDEGLARAPKISRPVITIRLVVRTSPPSVSQLLIEACPVMPVSLPDTNVSPPVDQRRSLAVNSQQRPAYSRWHANAMQPFSALSRHSLALGPRCMNHMDTRIIKLYRQTAAGRGGGSQQHIPITTSAASRNNRENTRVCARRGCFEEDCRLLLTLKNRKTVQQSKQRVQRVGKSYSRHRLRAEMPIAHPLSPARTNNISTRRYRRDTI